MKSLKLAFYLLHAFTIVCQNSQGQEAQVGKTIKLESKILGESRLIYIYEPKGLWGFDKELVDLPVIYVLDGETQFMHTAASIEFLSASATGVDLMPRALVIGIPNVNRNKDLTPIKGIVGGDSTTLAVTGGGPAFIRFIKEELGTYIDSAYSTSNHRTIIGHSMGGLLVFEALLRHHDYFNNYVVIDPGFGYADRKYMNEVLSSLRYNHFVDEHAYFASAKTRPTFMSSEELHNDSSDIIMLLDQPNSIFRKFAKEEDWAIDMHIHHYDDENHFTIPIEATKDALKALFDFYPFPEMVDYYHPSFKNRTDLLPRLQKHFNEISRNMGYKVIPTEGYINSFAYGLAAAGRRDLALELFKYNVEIHPQSSPVLNSLGNYYLSIDLNKEALGIFRNSYAIEKDDELLELIKSLE